MYLIQLQWGKNKAFPHQIQAGLKVKALTLFEISGLSLEEIREIQGGSLPGVKSRVQRGRKKLAEIMGVDDGKNDKQKYNIGSKSKPKQRISHNRLSAALRMIFAEPREVCYEL